ncbi:hypothetical protein FTUN_0829 [Frigoriglobus tundricola]|uniref:Uncharacterized protein n=1 Tax=Frigoriglobus tundricola TaxID=2774151 RepID=A0A6M5YJ82_9BACT|nr:hypothetical protein FTUN_0829 [Frigoriglobus tundricola]
MIAGPDKNSSILEVLDRLWSRLGPEAFVLTDHWEADPWAVGISSPSVPGVLVYISTYAEPPGRFGYELELPPPVSSESRNELAGRGSGVSFEELARVVASHMRRAERGTAPDWVT